MPNNELHLSQFKRRAESRAAVHGLAGMANLLQTLSLPECCVCYEPKHGATDRKYECSGRGHYTCGDCFAEMRGRNHHACPLCRAPDPTRKPLTGKLGTVMQVAIAMDAPSVVFLSNWMSDTYLDMLATFNTRLIRIMRPHQSRRRRQSRIQLAD